MMDTMSGAPDTGTTPESLKDALIVDVLEHMKKQNERLRANNKNQKDSNNRLQFVSRMMVALVVVVLSVAAVLVWVGTTLRQVTAVQVSQTRKIDDTVARLELMGKSFDKKLETTPEQGNEEVKKLAKKVDEQPKVVADGKGGLSLEVSKKKVEEVKIVPPKPPSKPPTSAKPAPKELIPIKGF
jgi:hypothetical protein